MESPLKELRNKYALTIPSIAQQIGINYKVYSANEACTYSAPLPALLKFYAEKGENLSALRQAYYDFQHAQRRTNGAKLQLQNKTTLEGDYESTKSPFEHFRNELIISRAGFSKQFCIQVGLLFRLERGTFVALPTDLKIALTEGGLPQSTLEELNYRTGEYFEHVRALLPT